MSANIRASSAAAGQDSPDTGISAEHREAATAIVRAMMSQTQIHKCFNTIIIDMCIQIMLPLSHYLNPPE